MPSNYSKIIGYALIANLGIYFYSFLLGYDRPFWIDEIHVIGASKNIFSTPLREVFAENLHPPLYFYLVGLINFTGKFQSTFYEDHLYYLRIVNILGFIPLFFSFKILKEKFKDININFILLLIISSHVFFYFSIELKMYFITFCLSFLIHSIFLVDENENKYKFVFYISTILLTLFNVFGLTISMSIILVQSIRNLYFKEYKKLLVNILIATNLFILFAIMFYFATIDLTNLKALSWIKFQKWYFRAFFEWTFPTVLIIIIMSFFIVINERFKNIFSFKKNLDINLNVLKITIPSIILVIVASLISLKHPVITHRNLIVTFPAGIILAGLLSIKYFKYKNQKSILILFLIFISFINFKFYKKNVIYAGENIRWVIEKSFNKECENVPIYFNDRGKILWEILTQYSIDIYADYSRPIKRLTKINYDEIKKNISQNKNCNIHVATFHYRHFEKYIKKLINEDIDLKIIYAPDVVEKNSSKAGAIAILKE